MTIFNNNQNSFNKKKALGPKVDFSQLSKATLVEFCNAHLSKIIHLKASQRITNDDLVDYWESCSGAFQLEAIQLQEKLQRLKAVVEKETNQSTPGFFKATNTSNNHKEVKHGNRPS